MNEGAYFESINKSCTFLKDLGILQKINYNNIKKSSIKKYSKAFVEYSRAGIYVEVYRCAMENDDYDILLCDGSFFQFSYDPKGNSENVRYAYYPSLCQVSYEYFLEEELDSSYEEVGDEFLEIYQQYVIEKEPTNVTPIRYDYSDEIYSEIVHSASHIHFGFEENIRVPINKKIKPLLFIKLVVEYFFYEKWKKEIVSGNRNMMYRNADFEEMNIDFFTVADRKVPYVTIETDHVL